MWKIKQPIELLKEFAAGDVITESDKYHWRIESLLGWGTQAVVYSVTHV